MRVMAEILQKRSTQPHGAAVLVFITVETKFMLDAKRLNHDQDEPGAFFETF